MEIRKLKASDYDELLEFLNVVFANKYGRAMDFLCEQPKMWVRSDECMSNHIAVFDGGRLASVVGVYPLPAMIDGTPVMFATTGNVATHPDFEGRGYFTRLFTMAMEELDAIDADAARLGGARQRYGRFGFEPVGCQYKFTINEKNRKKCYKSERKIEFIPVEKNDIDSLKFIKALYERQPVYVLRSGEDNLRDVFLALSSKHAAPYIAICDGKPIGYISAYADNQFVGISEYGRHIAEINALTADDTYDMVMQWQERTGKEVDIPLAPHKVEELRRISRVAEAYTISSPSYFKFRKFDNAANALLRLKSKYTDLPTGECVIDIKDYGKLCLYNRGGVSGCEATALPSDITLERSDAQRLIFGPTDPSLIADVPWILRAFLPLPLSWNTNDFV